jgi:tetratricopeptide (TPR) repeat protein
MAKLIPASLHLFWPLIVSRRFVVGAILLGTAMGIVAPAVHAQPPQDRTIFEDVPQLFKPRRPRTEAEDDLLNSGAHFAQARLLLQRQNKAMALRHFQRAWRFNSDRVALLDQIVAVASELGRNEQAARYAILSAERLPRNARLLIQLAGLLAQHDTSRAVQMYERAIELQQVKKLTPQSVAIRIEMGRLYFLNEDYKNAARIFSVVLEAFDDPKILTAPQRKVLLPKPHALYSLIADSFLKDGQLDKAAAMFRKADSFKSNAPRLDFHLAKIALQKTAYKDARKLLDSYLDSKSTAGGDGPYRILRKVCEHEHEDAAKAESAFLAELHLRHARDPKNVPLGYFLASELLAKDQLEAASELYVDLLKLQVTTDAYMGLAKIYRRQQDVEKLLEIIEQVAAKTESLDVLADELVATVANEDLTRKLLDYGRDKCKDAPENVRHATALALAHLAILAGKLEEFDTFAKIAGDAAGEKKGHVLEQLGLAVFVAEDAERATKLFRQALDEKPDKNTESTIQYYLSGALQFADDTEAALVAATKAGELRSEDPRFASRKPWILFQARQYERAEHQYVELLAKYDSTFDAAQVRDVVRDTKLILSNIAVERQQLPQAEEWLAQVLDEFPEDIGAKNDLGYLWADQGKHLQRALVMINQAVAAEPENIAYRDSLGWVYYRLGRFADAIRELKIASAGEDPDGVILDHLADAHLHENQPEQAIAAWQKALTAFREGGNIDRLPAIEAKINKHRED